MKKGQIHQINEKAAKELQESMVMLNDIGHSIKSLHNVLIEISLCEGCDNIELAHLNPHEKHNISNAIMLLGELATKETYRVAKNFGLKTPC